MGRLKVLAVFVIGVLMTACTPSLNPLFTEEDLVFEPRLLGKWVFEEDEHSRTEWTFTKAGDKAYGLVHLEDGDPARFEAHLLKLGESWFLDLYPEEPDRKNGFYKLHTVRAHTFARITLNDNVLSISLMDQEWLKKELDNGDLAIAHEATNGGGILLTAPTAELQQLVLKILDNHEAFPDASSFHRAE